MNKTYNDLLKECKHKKIMLWSCAKELTITV